MGHRYFIRHVFPVLALSAWFGVAFSEASQSQVSVDDLARGITPPVDEEIFLDFAARAMQAELVCPDLEVNSYYIQGVADGAGLMLHLHPIFRESFHKAEKEIKEIGAENYCKLARLALMTPPTPYLLPRPDRESKKGK